MQDQILVDLLADRVRELSDRLLETMYVGLDRRLYRCLLRLGEVYADRDRPRRSCPLTQDQLSDLVGGTRPTVNQMLQRLRTSASSSWAGAGVVVLDAAGPAPQGRPVSVSDGPVPSLLTGLRHRDYRFSSAAFTTSSHRRRGPTTSRWRCG